MSALHLAFLHVNTYQTPFTFLTPAHYSTIDVPCINVSTINIYIYIISFQYFAISKM